MNYGNGKRRVFFDPERNRTFPWQSRQFPDKPPARAQNKNIPPGPTKPSRREKTHKTAIGKSWFLLYPIRARRASKETVSLACLRVALPHFFPQSKLLA